MVDFVHLLTCREALFIFCVFFEVFTYFVSFIFKVRLCKKRAITSLHTCMLPDEGQMSEMKTMYKPICSKYYVSTLL